MDRNRRILALLLLLVVWGVFLLFYKVRDLEFTGELVSSFFIRNLTWQTNFLSHAPYKKGDELEYSAIFSSEAWQIVRVNIDAIRQNIDIDAVRFNDELIPETALEALDIRESGILKITGKAKASSTDKSQTASEAFRVTPINQSQKIAAIQPPLAQTGALEASPPSDITLSSARFNSNIPNLLSIWGQHLETIATVNIGGVSFRPTYSAEGTLYVELDRDVFSGGEYFVFFVLKNGKIITINTKITFEHSASKINIANITPNVLDNSEARYIVLQGNGFDKIVSVQLNNNLILKDAEFNTINSHVVGIKIPKWLSPGEYYFNIMDTESIYELSNVKFTVTGE